MKTRPILTLVGPTASGKTPVSLVLAELLNGEIVSADSRQVYKFLNIGTAKPSDEERKRIPHYFVDCLDPREEYSAWQYADDARKVLKELFERGKIPILVGGSGLYIKAVIDGLFDGPGKDPEIREKLEDELRTQGLDTLLATLKKVDPVALERMAEVTPRRVIRALEVYYIAGKPLSELQASPGAGLEFSTHQFSLEWERCELYSRINQRVDEMILAGLEEEVRGLLTMGFDRHLNALNTVGYKEVFDSFEGITDRETMIDLIKRNTRRFAKRQTTWFGADKRIRRIPMSGGFDPATVAKKIVHQYQRLANG